MFQIGDKVGSYVLAQPIGSGAFGDVWLAEKAGIVTTRFALKLPKGTEVDPAVFKDEARIWAQASGHTNVVPIIEADSHNVVRNRVTVVSDQIVIVSEYMSDGSLQSQLISTGGKAPTVQKAAQLTMGILAGLRYLHTRKPVIIHRDLKPDNVLMQDETPRLTDFGISRALKSDSYLKTVGIAGTLPFMAPEVFRGEFSARTDVWAAGVILYQLLSGRLPFQQTDIPALISAIVNDQPADLPGGVPVRLARVVGRALTKDPDLRFRSAAEMRDSLDAALTQDDYNGPTIPVTPESIPTPRRPRDVDPIPPSFVDDRAPQPPIRRWLLAVIIGLLLVGGGALALIYWPAGSGKSNLAADIPINSPSPSDSPVNVITPTPVDSRPLPVLQGITEAETADEAIFIAHPKGGIMKWFIHPGDLLNPCGKFLGDRLVHYYFYQTIPGPNGSSYEMTFEDDVHQMSPAVLMSIDVHDTQDYYSDQKIGTVGRILHIWVNAKISVDFLPRLAAGSPVSFTDTKTKRVFKGTLETADALTGNVRIKLADDAVFSRETENCLTISVGAKGDVKFGSPDTTSGK
ncbi:MAG: serine/threonine protein kinase [Pyrinomonadaceae bacterium]